jgi:hypothetical protein
METTEKRAQAPRETMIIQVGFDVLDILTVRFEKEMGRAFLRVWNESLAGMEGLPGALFEGIQPGPDNRDINRHIVRTRWEDREDRDDPGILLDAFLGVLDKQLEAARRVLGLQIVQQAIGEAVHVLSMVDKYEGDTEVAKAFLGRLRGAPA